MYLPFRMSAAAQIYMELIRNGCAATILETGAVMKTAFCGPCFGAGDTPANNALSSATPWESKTRFL